MNKLFLFALLLMVTGLMADGVQPDGSGTEADPYLVATLDNLLWISTNSGSWGSYIIQTADIDATDTQNWNDGEGFSPIGTQSISARFTGEYDGQNHTIDGLSINRPENDYQGLFGMTYGATIENLGATNVDVSGHDRVGGLVGFSFRYSVISNCYSTGSVEGNDKVGGLVGDNFVGNTISDCYSMCNVEGDVEVGGLVGNNYSNSTINNCFSSGNVEGDDNVGGLVGWNRYYASVNNCYSTGNVSGDNDVGGLVGMNDRYSTVSNCFYNLEAVLINGVHVITIGALDSAMYDIWMNDNLNLNIDDYLTNNGGVYLISSVEDLRVLLAFGQFAGHSFILESDLDLLSEANFYIPCFRGHFNGDGHVIDNLNINIGCFLRIGLFGFTEAATIENLGVTNVDVSGDTYVGGLVGENRQSTVSACYSTGSVSGSNQIGGLVGENYQSTVSDCYSVGNVSGEWCIGGLVGWNTYHSTISNSCSAGNVSGNWGVGGLVGSSVWVSVVNNCYSTCNVVGDDWVGGLVGENYRYPIVGVCSTAGSVSGDDRVGILMGLREEPTISNCYSTGSVDGIENRVGGLVGSSSPPTIISNCFWNIETSGQSTSAGGTGKTTAEMQDIATYTSVATYGLDTPWDFVGNPFDDTGAEDYWDIDGTTNSGYPFLTDLPVGIADDEAVPPPASAITLHPNFPNPFNPTTTIRFSVPERQSAMLEIFNLRGQLVRSYPAFAGGSHEVVWNGVDNSGYSVGSGVYLYRLQAGGHSITRRMVLLK